MFDPYHYIQDVFGVLTFLVFQVPASLKRIFNLIWYKALRNAERKMINE